MVTRTRPKLRVVAPDRPRGHCVVFQFSLLPATLLEIFTFAEWDAMHPAARPDDARFVPGIGWATYGHATEGEAQGVRETALEALAEYHATRPLD